MTIAIPAAESYNKAINIGESIYATIGSQTYCNVTLPPSVLSLRRNPQHLPSHELPSALQSLREHVPKLHKSEMGENVRGQQFINSHSKFRSAPRVLNKEGHPREDPTKPPQGLRENEAPEGRRNRRVQRKTI